MSINQIHAFEGMTAVKEKYGEAGVNDKSFAIYLSTQTRRKYSTAQIRSYRTALGIPNNEPTSTPSWVWVASSGSGEILGVFSSRQKAEDFRVAGEDFSWAEYPVK